MEKLIYLLGQPDGSDPEQLKRRLHGATVPALAKAGASRIRSCVRDAHVAPGERLWRGDLAGQIWCYLSLWTHSRTRHPALRELLQEHASFIHAYSVTESEQLFRDVKPDGSRAEGINHVVCLRKLERLSRDEFLTIWLESHTQVATEVQPTFGYVQHVVVDAIEPGSPRYDGIVEENFPEAAMTSHEGFFGAEGEELHRRMRAMGESCARFIDIPEVLAMPMSEYNFPD